MVMSLPPRLGARVRTYGSSTPEAPRSPARRCAVNSSSTARPDRICFDNRRAPRRLFCGGALAFAVRLSLSLRISSRTNSLGVAQSPEATRWSTYARNPLGNTIFNLSRGFI